MRNYINYIIGLVAIGVLGFAGFYYGFLRNEGRCYNQIAAELDEDMKVLEDWSTDPPDYVQYSALELAEINVQVAESGLVAFNIKNDPHRSICDYYVYGMSLRRK